MLENYALYIIITINIFLILTIGQNITIGNFGREFSKKILHNYKQR